MANGLSTARGLSGPRLAPPPPCPCPAWPSRKGRYPARRAGKAAWTALVVGRVWCPVRVRCRRGARPALVFFFSHPQGALSLLARTHPQTPLPFPPPPPKTRNHGPQSCRREEDQDGQEVHQDPGHQEAVRCVCVGRGKAGRGRGRGARGRGGMRDARRERVVFFSSLASLSRPSPSSLLPTPTPQAPTSTSGACPRAQGDPLDPSPCVTLAVGGAGGAGDGAGRVAMGGARGGERLRREEAGRERGRSALHPPPRSSPLSGGRMGTSHPPRPPPQWVVRLAGHPLGGRAGGRQQASAELLGPARMGRGVSFPP